MTTRVEGLETTLEDCAGDRAVTFELIAPAVPPETMT